MKHKVNFEIEFKENKYPGKFIVLEGIDGSGKTTQVERLEKELAKRKIKVWSTKNPTNHSIGKFIRRVLAGYEKIPPQSIQYLFNADRVVQQEEIVEKLKKGFVVISDRYFWSSVAYGMADMNDISDRFLTAYSILSFYHQFLIPDVTFFLDLDASESLDRLGSKKKEIYEKESFLKKVNQMYKYLIEKFPEQFTIVDGNNSVDVVTSKILNTIYQILNTK